MNQTTTQSTVSPQAAQSTHYVDERLLRAELAVAEARTDTKFAELLGELKVISNNVANLATQISDVKTEIGDVKTATASVKWNIIATGLAVGALILGLFAYGQQMMQLALQLAGK